jgi:DNA-binding cell septation regulator SpoVG
MNIKAKVFKREYNNLKGVASITIDDCFIITGITIMNGKNGLFVSMPNKKNNKGEYKDICYPLNVETRKQITEDLKLIDVVIEILDARIPMSSQNPQIKQITQNKKKVVVLNKCDLSDEKENKKWMEFFIKQGNKVV